MPARSKDAIICDLKKELEAMRLEDRSTKSELSKAKISLEKNETIVKDLQIILAEWSNFMWDPGRGRRDIKSWNNKRS